MGASAHPIQPRVSGLAAPPGPGWRRWIAVVVALVLAIASASAIAADDGSAGDEVDYLALAGRLLADGNYGRAERALGQVDPAKEGVDRVRYSTLRGLVELRQGDNADAVAALERAIAERRARPEGERADDWQRQLQLAHLYLGQAEYRRGEYGAALAALDKAGPVADDSPSVQALRAQAHWQLDDEVAAFAALQRGQQRFPADTRFQRREIFYLIELGFYRRAAEVGKAYLDRGKAGPDDFLAIGSALRKSGQYRAALDILERARLTHSRHKGVNLELARVYLDQKRKGVAADLFAEQAAYHPELQREAAELQRQAGRPYRALLLNAGLPDQKAKLKQRLAILVDMERWAQASAMGPALRRNGVLAEGEIRYAYAYALFKAGDYDRAGRVLAGIDSGALFRKATELRKAMERCRQARWQCL